MKKGYSLVELMVTISIVGILVSFGVSAYGRGRDRREGRAAGEQIIGFLSENQKKANIGDEDCTGLYTGQSIVVSSGTGITATSVCSGGNGTPVSTTISGISSMTAGTITFKPLAGGATLTSDPYNINYVTTSGTTYQVQITSSGTIDYKGVQP